MSCPCGSGTAYDDCCGPIHRDEIVAPTALALMRSRYAAFAVEDATYLRRSWHPSTRPARVDLDDGTEWQRLHVVDTERGGESDDDGVVEFVARWRRGDERGSLRERSRFVRERGRWYYVDGEVLA